MVVCLLKPREGGAHYDYQLLYCIVRLERIEKNTKQNPRKVVIGIIITSHYIKYYHLESVMHA